MLSKASYTLGAMMLANPGLVGRIVSVRNEARIVLVSIRNEARIRIVTTVTVINSFVNLLNKRSSSL